MRAIVRVEDTDAGRNVAGAERAILADLAWLGLAWDGLARTDGDLERSGISCGPLSS